MLILLIVYVAKYILTDCIFVKLFVRILFIMLGYIYLQFTNNSYLINFILIIVLLEHKVQFRQRTKIEMHNIVGQTETEIVKNILQPISGSGTDLLLVRCAESCFDF